MPRAYHELRAEMLKLIEQIQIAGKLVKHDSSHVMPTEVVEQLPESLQAAPDGEYRVDVIQLGAPDASSLMINSSGTHGVEGLAGMECQIKLLREYLDGKLDLEAANQRLALVVGVNPVGVQHSLRNTGGNVDLNRNGWAVDDNAGELPESPVGYLTAVEPFLTSHFSFWPALIANVLPGALLSESAPFLQTVYDHCPDFIAGYLQRVIVDIPQAALSLSDFKDALTHGQSVEEKGAYYCGRERTWEAETLEAIVLELLGHAKNIAWLDIHTGLGDAGEVSLLGEPGDSYEDYAWMKAMFGDAVEAHLDDEGDMVSSPQMGDLPAAITVKLREQGINIHTVTSEYGTLSGIPVLKAMFYENRWRRAGCLPEQRAAVMNENNQAFFIEGEINVSWKDWIASKVNLVLPEALRLPVQHGEIWLDKVVSNHLELTLSTLERITTPELVNERQKTIYEQLSSSEVGPSSERWEASTSTASTPSALFSKANAIKFVALMLASYWSYSNFVAPSLSETDTYTPKPSL